MNVFEHCGMALCSYNVTWAKYLYHEDWNAVECLERHWYKANAKLSWSVEALQSPLVVTGTCSLILTKGLLIYNSFQPFKSRFINCYGMVYYKFCRTKLFAVCLCRRNGEQERRWKWRSPPRTDWHRNKRSQFIMLHHNYRACRSLSVSLCVNCLLLISVIKVFINIM